jgi:hypothetical protein
MTDSSSRVPPASTPKRGPGKDRAKERGKGSTHWCGKYARRPWEDDAELELDTHPLAAPATVRRMVGDAHHRPTPGGADPSPPSAAAAPSSWRSPSTLSPGAAAFEPAVGSPAPRATPRASRGGLEGALVTPASASAAAAAAAAVAAASPLRSSPRPGSSSQAGERVGPVGGLPIEAVGALTFEAMPGWFSCVGPTGWELGA